ncbi:MAG: Sua5/YciO/YrdC/YwlC family protein [Halobacteriovoraceae bacterium]|nr:Sua5/YciO/YrdC/YwlC family protein [Halobacteriovoraceae bacterium]
MKYSNKIFIYPTDTVWGLGCGIYSESGVEKIVKLKKIEKARPFSVLFYELEKSKEFFSFPSYMNDSWLKNFFSLQSALALPLSIRKKEIPYWITAGSTHVVVRILSLPSIKEIIDEVQAPIITTSLNFSGNDPICDRNEALLFHQRHMPKSRFIDKETSASAMASTIVAWKDDEIKFWRIGEKAKEIHRLCLDILPKDKVHLEVNICK